MSGGNRVVLVALLVAAAVSLVGVPAAWADPPSPTATPDRGADSSGWYNHPFSVTFSGTASTAVTCAPATANYSGPDTAGASLSSTCTDTDLPLPDSATATFDFKYDATAPTVTGVNPDRAPDSNGWYNHPVAFTAQGTDALSGIAGCSSVLYSGPASAGASVTGTCTDNAGNTGSAATTFKYDATAPTNITATPDRLPNANGWYNQPVTFTVHGTDAQSGIFSCPNVTYSGPDSATATVMTTCIDNAGNAGSVPVSFKYEATQPTVTSVTPSRPIPDSNGWYNKPVAFTFRGSATSGNFSCTSIYVGPDSATAATSVPPTCVDKAGNAPAPLANPYPFKYDATPPTVTGAKADITPSPSGWYTSPVTFTFTGNDNASGLGPQACTTVTYSGPNTQNGLVTGTCTDAAGNTSAPFTVSFKYNAGPLTIVVRHRPPDANDWYNHPVKFTFTGTDATSANISCNNPVVNYAGPDNAHASVSDTCTDTAGHSETITVRVKYDSTPPTIRVLPHRRADFNGWYNHPLKLRFKGIDGVSGIDRCLSVLYTGPDSAKARAHGRCVDHAGNVARVTVRLRYHSTPPSLAVSGDTGDRLVVLRWRASSDVGSLAISRTPGQVRARAGQVFHVHAGVLNDAAVQDGVRYRYTFRARDRYGSVKVRRLVLIPGPRLVAPATGVRMSGPPLLRWTSVVGASYYNVQLYRNGTKVLSIWPSHTGLLLGTSWVYRGRHQALVPGTYQWYVWPGYGPLAAARYGALIGARTFVVT